MKKTLSIILICAAALSLASCKDFLTLDTEASVANDNFWQTDQQAIDAVDACYYYWDNESLLGREIMWEEGQANDLVWGRTRAWPDLATMTLTTTTDVLDEIWKLLFRIQNRSNWVIQSLLDKQETTELTEIESRSLGEAYFNRALAHFYVAYRYGTGKQGVPFVRYEDYPEGYNNQLPAQSATVMEDYAMIVEDFTKAASLLPRCEDYSDADFGRAHKAACYGFMAKAYTYWAAWDKSQYSNVITCVDKMEKELGRSIEGVAFTDNFTSDYSKWRNSEYVWAIPGNGGTNATYGGSEFPGVILDNGLWGWFNCWGQFKPSLDIYEEFCKDNGNLEDPELGNIRMKNSLVEYGDVVKIWGEPDFRFYSIRDVESGFMITKYVEPYTHAEGGYYTSSKDGSVLTGDAIYTDNRIWNVPTGQDPISLGYTANNGDCPMARLNFPIMRFADCILLRAEAYLANGNAAAAATDINTIRKRANVKLLTGNATWADLYHERRVELAFEHSGHMYDCKRWALSGDSEIKELALGELNTHPRARHYKNRASAGSYVNGVFVVNTDFTVGPYEDYQTPLPQWADYKIVLPYSSEEIAKYNGLLHQNEGY